MKLLFITGCYDHQIEDVLQKKCINGVGLQNAPNAFQWGVITGLAANNVNYSVLSYPLLPVYPIRFKSIFTPKAPIVFNGSVIGSMRRYCTIVGIKPLSIIYRLRDDVEKWILSNDNSEKKTILIYSTYTFYLKAILPLKKKYKNLTVAVIITDLIDDALNFTQNNTFFKKIQVNRDFKYIKEAYSQIDKFILLTSAMTEKIPEAKENYIVVEGICSNVNTLHPKKEPSVRSILYTGTLQKFVGINEFVDAFHKVSNENLKLVICGAGASSQYIDNIAKMDSRIIYKGLVSREEALRLQKEATFLVNPRKPTEDITRYSFPSKTMEYLSSGTPMIGYLLAGIPSDYYEYIYSPKDNSIDSMVSLIEELSKKSIEELNTRAEDAFNFVMQFKSAKTQVLKIIKYLES